MSVSSAPSPTSRPASTPRRWLVPLALAAAVISGVMMSGQSLINGELGRRLHDPYSGALISFGSGLVVLTVIVLTSPVGRAGFPRLWSALRTGELRWRYLLAGTLGAVMVFSQAAVISTVGVAHFAVGVVAGQILMGVVVDRWGLVGVMARALTWNRVAGAALVVVAALIAAVPQSAGAGAATLIPLLAPFVAGMLMSVQVGCNGAIARAAGTMWVAAFINFAVGTVVLGGAWLATRGLAGVGDGGSVPPQWWLYLGGSIGVMVVAAHSRLVGIIGALVLGLAAISGQLFGGAMLSWQIPLAGDLHTSTVVAALVAFTAVAIGALPRKSGA